LFFLQNLEVLIGALRSVFLTKYHSDDQVKNTEMGMACSTMGEAKVRIGI
jgi:hypothetical protein